MRNLRARNRVVQKLCLETPTLQALLSANLIAYDLAVATAIFGILPNSVRTGNPPQGVHYDLVVQPEIYANPYLKLAKLYEDNGLKLFNAVPLSTSLIPRHVVIDTAILCYQVLGVTGNGTALKISEKKFNYWGSVFNLRHHAFKERSGMKFDGFIRTDGVSVSINIVTPGQNKQRKRKRKHGTPTTTEYFQDHIPELKHNMVFIDPNRRDLLYCLGSNEKKLRYTSMQRRSETRAKTHDKIRSDIEVAAGLRNPVVRVPGNYRRPPSVSLPSSKTVNPAYFSRYLVNFTLAMAENEAVYAKVQFRKLKFAKYAPVLSLYLLY